MGVPLQNAWFGARMKITFVLEPIIFILIPQPGVEGFT